MNEQATFQFQAYPFGGKTFSAEQDGIRLTKHLQKVLDLMRSGEWFTLAELAKEVGCTESSASARIRDLRKPWAGSHKVERERVEGGLWRYRLSL